MKYVYVIQFDNTIEAAFDTIDRAQIYCECQGERWDILSYAFTIFELCLNNEATDEIVNPYWVYENGEWRAY